MALNTLRQAMPLASRQLRNEWSLRHPGMMRKFEFTHRMAHRNLLQAPYRSMHSFTQSQHHSNFRPSSFPRLWLLLPLGVGMMLYSRESPVEISAMFSSPHIIPSGTHPRLIMIDSPNEPRTSLLAQFREFLHSQIWEPIRTGFRFLHLLGIFLPVILTAPMLLVGPQEERYGGDRWGAVWWYGLLVRAMQRAGPTFIKLSQWAGSREDLFPAILCDKLGSLHSNGKPHSLAHTKRVIERVFGRAFNEVFEVFETTPIGVGAIAQ
ncbi:hypothetical protein FRC12_015335, partial [Ceratobasidium sp. 428]